MRVSRLIAAALIAAALIAALAWAEIAWADTATDFGVQVPHISKDAPDFVLPNLDGKQVALNSLRGKVILLHFWATWCTACRHEMPQIEQVWLHYRQQGLMVLGVNVDRGNEKGVRNFMHQRQLSFLSVHDSNGDVHNRYAVRALPTTYIIAANGTILGRIIGERDWSSLAAKRWLNALLLKMKR